MTGKRFKEEMGIAIFIDNQTGKEYSEYNLDEIVCLLNELHEENQELKRLVKVTVEDYTDLKQSFDLIDKENEQLKKELKVYHKVASCTNCKYHNYDWDIDDGYGGEEYEVCDKGNDVIDGICEDWEEL